VAADVAATVAVVVAVNAGKLSLEFAERERVSALLPFCLETQPEYGGKGAEQFSKQGKRQMRAAS